MLHYREAGEGSDVLLLVHGFPLDSRIWDGQLAAPAPGWRYVAPDLRGFGRSRPAGDGPYTMDLLADDLIAFMDQLGVERVVVAGLSMGGYIAFALWRRHPERVRALVLCDTRAVADTPEARDGRLQMAAKVRAEGSHVAADVMLPKLISDRTRERRPDLEQELRAIVASQPAEGVARAQEGMAQRADSRPTLATITAPALIIVGADDKIANVDEAAEMERSIPGARLVVVEGAGHLAPWEDPETVNAALEEFLQNLP